VFPHGEGLPNQSGSVVRYVACSAARGHGNANPGD
jgi:hypothetical protein